MAADVEELLNLPRRGSTYHGGVRPPSDGMVLIVAVWGTGGQKVTMERVFLKKNLHQVSDIALDKSFAECASPSVTLDKAFTKCFFTALLSVLDTPANFQFPTVTCKSFFIQLESEESTVIKKKVLAFIGF
jgi:hypothetical protein